MKRVEYWLRADTGTHGRLAPDDPAWQTAEWRPCQIEPPPKDWGGSLPDGVVLIAEPPGQMVPGGKHVETGMALVLGRPVFVIGRKENIFHWHPAVRVFADLDALMAHLGPSR